MKKARKRLAVRKGEKPAAALPERREDAPARQDIEAAIETLGERIDLIARHYADDPGMTDYRRTLEMAVWALRKQLPGGS